MKKNLNRTLSLCVVLLIYAAALAAGFLIFSYFSEKGSLIAMLYADIGATIIVWLFGIILKNASVYDPYWSIIPPVIFIFWVLIKSNAATIDILLIIASLVWGIRLTYNWIIGFTGFDYVDWRYKMLKAKNEKLWFFTNLIGINMMPTFIVFGAMIPAYYSIAANINRINLITVIGFLICLSAASIQYISDSQMRRFKKSNAGHSCIDSGLWRYSRHPNYFGEVSFWWGIWIIQISILPNLWVTVLGPVFMTLLFLFISIPMMEKRNENKENYREYKDEVSVFIPWFRKQKL